MYTTNKYIDIDKNNSVLKNILILLLPYKKKIFISLILSLLITLLTTLSPLVAQKLIDNGIMFLNFSVSLKLASLIIIITILEKTISLLQSILHINLRNQLYISLQLNMLKKVLVLKINSFKESGFQSIFESLNFDIDAIAAVADKSFLLISMEIFKIAGGLIALCSINYKLTLFVLLLIPVQSLITNILAKFKTKLFDALVISFENMGKWCEEIINGISEIKISNLYRKKEDEYNKLISNRLSLEKNVQILDEVDDYAGNIIGELILNLIYIIGVSLALKEDLTVGGIITFTMYSNIVTAPLSSLISIKYRFANVKPSIENFSEFLHRDEECSIKNLSAPKAINKITFKNVNLEFENKTALQNISLEFNAGEKIAFIGTNGSGKSSIINLLLRFYKPSRGEIYFNDLNISEINLNEYRNLFAVVSQNVCLFSRSIKENIDLIDSFSEKEILSFCKDNELLSFLDFSLKSKDGLNTQVGMNGDKLSGGEAQKVSFLRALLKENRKILILDEATANYDIESEQLFNKIIAESNSYDFTFIVSHRPEILKHMDKIVVLDKGEIKCVASYDYVVKNGLL